MSNQHKYNGKPYRISRNNGRPTQLYSRWMSMNGRCRDSGHTTHRFYGGKGVRVCEAWRASFDAFRIWALSAGFKKDLSLDRIDSDQDYCPDNCQWIPLNENRTKKKTHRGSDHYKAILTDTIVLNAHKMSREGWKNADIARFFGVSPKTIGGALSGRNWKHIKAIVDSKVLTEGDD